MEHAIYLKCRNPVMTYVDPQTKFKIPRGKIVKYHGGLTKTMQRWIRRGGLKRVEEALYLKQQESEPAREKKPLTPTKADKAPEKAPEKEESKPTLEQAPKSEKKSKKGKK